jgi:predicted nucleotidyltransferase
MIPGNPDFSWIVERINNNYRATEIYLFGSQAKGTRHDGSDIDLIIVGPSRLPRQRRGKEVAAALTAFPSNFDLLFYTEEELAEERADPYSFVSRVLACSRSLYSSGQPPGAKAIGHD